MIIIMYITGLLIGWLAGANMADSRIITMRLPVWLVDQIDSDAEANGLTRTDFIKKLYFDWTEAQNDLTEYISFMAATEAAERN